MRGPLWVGHTRSSCQRRALPALSRGRAVPILELVAHSISLLLLTGSQSCADALSPRRTPSAVSRPRYVSMISCLSRTRLADRPPDRVVEVSGFLRPAANVVRPPVPSAPIVVNGLCALQACQNVVHLRLKIRPDRKVESLSAAITLGHDVMGSAPRKLPDPHFAPRHCCPGATTVAIWLPHVPSLKRSHPSPSPT